MLTPQCPHLFNTTTYETTHLLLHVLIFLQFRSGRLCNHTRYPGATKNLSINLPRNYIPAEPYLAPNVHDKIRLVLITGTSCGRKSVAESDTVTTLHPNGIPVPGIVRGDVVHENLRAFAISTNAPKVSCALLLARTGIEIHSNVIFSVPSPKSLSIAILHVT